MMKIKIVQHPTKHNRSIFIFNKPIPKLGIWLNLFVYSFLLRAVHRKDLFLQPIIEHLQKKQRSGSNRIPETLFRLWELPDNTVLPYAGEIQTLKEKSAKEASNFYLQSAGLRLSIGCYIVEKVPNLDRLKIAELFGMVYSQRNHGLKIATLFETWHEFRKDEEIMMRFFQDSENYMAYTTYYSPISPNLHGKLVSHGQGKIIKGVLQLSDKYQLPTRRPKSRICKMLSPELQLQANLQLDEIDQQQN